ncbi:MAG: FHA domain-containing protein [Chlorobi bacterium]|nr:FHA domain-containing protein [Chlorobiota bacterium]
MMLFCCLKFVKKKNKKQNLPASGISKKSPIEINIKGKGFDKTYFFEKQLISIGRGTNNDVVIPDLTVSGKHAVISKEDNDFYIRDLGSTNGIKVKKKKVKKYKLKQKDTVKLGAVVLYVKF